MVNSGSSNYTFLNKISSFCHFDNILNCWLIFISYVIFCYFLGTFPNEIQIYCCSFHAFTFICSLHRMLTFPNVSSELNRMFPGLNEFSDFVNSTVFNL